MPRTHFAPQIVAVVLNFSFPCLAADASTWTDSFSATQSVHPFQPSTRANTRPPGEWNEFELLCTNQTYSVTMNGDRVTDWTDPKKRSAFGYIGLQNYNHGKTVRYRNVRVRTLD